MKRFFLPKKPGRSCRGFTLVEVVLSVGIVSFGFLALAPLVVTGMTSAAQARENRATAQIAATLVEEARQGSLADGLLYFDSTGSASTVAQAAYQVQASVAPCLGGSDPAAGGLDRLILQVTPLGSAAGVRNYVDVYVPPPPGP